jgi:hypothetical protein
MIFHDASPLISPSSLTADDDKIMIDSRMSDVQSVLHNALLEYDKADNEVERLLDIIDKATIALEKVRQSKRKAKIQLHEAIASASRASAVEEVKDSSYSEYSSEEESQSCSSGSGSEQQDEEERNESEDDDQIDIADEALEQIRYRLKVARIDPSSPQGATLLDALLIRLKNTDDTISEELIDELMDDLLNDNEEGSCEEVESKKEDEDDESCDDESQYDECPKQKQTRIKISRGGKVLGWYEGGLDDRGYAREGEGTMYYNAGHICSGYWQDDEMVGRGVYKWKDGHIYDVSNRFDSLLCNSCISFKISPTALSKMLG